MTRNDVLALAARVEAGRGSTLHAVEAMRCRIWDGCKINVPPATAGFALAAALRAIAERMPE